MALVLLHVGDHEPEVRGHQPLGRLLVARRARRASRFSSSGSEIIGSFWMSSRYWSKAPDGAERRNATDFPGTDVGHDQPRRRLTATAMWVGAAAGMTGEVESQI